MVLTVAILNRTDIRADPIDYIPASYRKAAYRQYILGMHGEEATDVSSHIVWFGLLDIFTPQCLAHTWDSESTEE